jgi:hypothetical protein
MITLAPPNVQPEHKRFTSAPAIPATAADIKVEQFNQLLKEAEEVL